MAKLEDSMDALSRHVSVAIGSLAEPMASCQQAMEAQLVVEYIPRPFEVEDLLTAASRQDRRVPFHSRPAGTLPFAEEIERTDEDEAAADRTLARRHTEQKGT